MSDQGVKNHPEGEDAVIHDLETEDRPPSAQDHEEQPDANPQEQPAPKKKGKLRGQPKPPIGKGGAGPGSGPKGGQKGQ